MPHQRLQLSIPQPCTENWDKMTPADKGRHCQSCDKIVVDFSRMTDAQVFDYFKNQTGKTCGRASITQLNRTITPAPMPQRFKPFKYIAAWLLAAEAFTYKAKAHDVIDIATVQLPADATNKPAADSSVVSTDTTEYCWEPAPDTTTANEFVIDITRKEYILEVTEINGYTVMVLGGIGACPIPEEEPGKRFMAYSPFFERVKKGLSAGLNLIPMPGIRMQVNNKLQPPAQPGTMPAGHTKLAVMVRRLRLAAYRFLGKQANRM